MILTGKIQHQTLFSVLSQLRAAPKKINVKVLSSKFHAPAHERLNGEADRQSDFHGFLIVKLVIRGAYPSHSNNFWKVVYSGHLTDLERVRTGVWDLETEGWWKWPKVFNSFNNILLVIVESLEVQLWSFWPKLTFMHCRCCTAWSLDSTHRFLRPS